MNRRLTAGIVFTCMLLVLWRSAAAAEAVRQGLALCAKSLIPSLFPFFVLSSLFISMGYAETIGRRLSPLTRRPLGCGGAGAAVFLLGLIGGYPVGGRTVGQLYREGRLSQSEAEHLLAFCNNAGPSFALGFMGLGCFGSLRAGLLLYLIHAASAALSGILLADRHTIFSETQHTINPPPLLPSLIRSVQDAAGTMLHVCAFTVFARVAQGLFFDLTHICHPAALGFLEISGGAERLSGDRTGFIWAAALLGWGGLSVHGQTAAVLADTNLRMGRYVLGKGLQAALSAGLAALLFRWAL